MKRLLVANRGEIACRILRSAHALGLETVAVYSEADRNALHVQQAGQAVCIGPAETSRSYLNQAAILEAARSTGADAIHPGYGFLSENAAFARACEQAGLRFVGPPAQVIERAGEKHRARAVAQDIGVPVLPGTRQASAEMAWLEKQARALGMPLMLKPVAGGGGRGMRNVSRMEELPAALQAAMREAEAAFGDSRLLLERHLDKPRHVEVQVLMDTRGRGVYLFERDCSLQRRHQKIIEESPAPGLDESLRTVLGEAALKLARAVGYQGAGTVEFLLDDSGWYFVEMNTRLQVEHPVTEAVTGVDLVAWQLRIAAGEPLSLRQQDLALEGHALELRLCAEDPARAFLPQTGTIRHLRWPQGSGLRIDTGYRQGDRVSSHYDSLLAKIIVHGHDREAALGRAKRALEQLQIDGVVTNRQALLALLDVPRFRQGCMHVQWLDEHPDILQWQPELDRVLAVLALWQVRQVRSAPLSLNGPARYLFHWRAEGRDHRVVLCHQAGWSVEVDRQPPVTGRVLAHSGTALQVELDGACEHWQVTERPGGWWVSRGSAGLEIQPSPFSDAADGERHTRLEAPMPGRVLECRVETGTAVQAGEVLLVLEAMKMEHSVRAPADGRVRCVRVRAGDTVEAGQCLLEME